jgi:hypothetical protein
MAKKGIAHPVGVSPEGVVKYAWLERPDDRFGKSEFSITLAMDLNKPGVKEWAAGIKALKPGLKHYGGFKIEKETGLLLVVFKSKKQPTAFLDSKLNFLRKGIYPAKGSIVKVEFAPYEYDLQGGCMALYINKIQVIKLVEWKTSTLFKKEEGFECDPNDKGAAPDEGAAAAPAADEGEQPQDAEQPPDDSDDSNLPF